MIRYETVVVGYMNPEVVSLLNSVNGQIEEFQILSCGSYSGANNLLKLNQGLHLPTNLG